MDAKPHRDNRDMIGTKEQCPGRTSGHGTPPPYKEGGLSRQSQDQNSKMIFSISPPPPTKPKTMKLTPKPQPQKEEHADLTAQVADLAAKVAALTATVADLLDLNTKLVLRSVEHSQNFTTHSGWIAEHEIRLRGIDGATSAAEATAPIVPSAKEARHAEREMVTAIERMRDQMSKDLEFYFNRVTARLDKL
jgi:hypothetical protein